MNIKVIIFVHMSKWHIISYISCMFSPNTTATKCVHIEYICLYVCKQAQHMFFYMSLVLIMMRLTSERSLYSCLQDSRLQIPVSRLNWRLKREAAMQIWILVEKGKQSSLKFEMCIMHNIFIRLYTPQSVMMCTHETHPTTNDQRPNTHYSD